MPDVKDVKWGEDNALDVAPVLSEEEKHTLRQKTEALDKLLAEAGKAKYKIEIIFSHRRNLTGISAGILSIWESGTKLHGGGDTKMYWCPAKEKKLVNCDGMIPDASAGYGFLVCPSCKNVWKGEDVYGELLFKLTAKHWADVLLKQYTRMGHNADIYAKYPKHDLRRAAEAEQGKQMMGAKLAKARTERDVYIYPLKHIISDVSNGSDLLSRFYAFLTA